jgi:hypothetical protein
VPVVGRECLRCGAADDALGVSVVPRAVGGVDLVVHVARLDEEDILVDTAGLDVGFVTHLGAAERQFASVAPRTTSSAWSSNVIGLISCAFGLMRSMQGPDGCRA